MKLQLRRIAMATAVATTLAFGGGGAAQAATSPASAPVVADRAAASISEREYALAFAQFESTDVARDIAVVDGVQAVTFHLTEGFSLTLVDPKSAGLAKPSAPGAVTPFLSGGRTKAGMYIGFNQTDQAVLGSVAASTILTAAICAIPAVGQAACVVAGVAIAIASGYVLANGVCSNKRTLYWYDVRAPNGARGSTVACRSTPPR